MFHKCIFSLIFLVAVSQVQAAIVWEIKDNYIDEVSIHHDYVAPSYYHVISVKLRNPISTGCALSDSSRAITFFINAEITPALSLWHSTLLAAQAQGSKVDIKTDNAVCNPTYGRLLQGVRIKSK
jgi:hypothetical protein